MNTPQRLLPCLAGLLFLSACATNGDNVRVEKLPVPTLERTLADADTALATGQDEKAQSILKSAAGNYPADKTPWLHMAQIKFDRASYGDAIVNALEALQRDPTDRLANSIVAVSGLRLSTKALSDLSQQNNLNGSLKSEAQDMAKLLRTSLGEDVLVPTPNVAARKPLPVLVKKGGTAATAATAPATRVNNQINSNDPFGGLK